MSTHCKWLEKQFKAIEVVSQRVQDVFIPVQNEQSRMCAPNVAIQSRYPFDI